ncbi:MAG: ATP-binding protein, partial [Gemmataceae bacterium]
MTTDARLIRAGRYAEIGAVLRRDTTALIDRWATRAAEEQPTAKRVHHQTLLDELPELLGEIGRALEESGADGHAPSRHWARRHAEQRWETGWSIAELVRDYRILRLVVLADLDETLDRPLRLNEAQAVGLALDEAIEESVARYAHSREEEAKRSEAALKAREQALKDADRRKNEFLATLAHELRNPLAPLRNSLEVVRLRADTPAAVREARELMDRQVVQLTRLVEDLLDVARIAEGKLELRTAPLDLRHAVEQAAQMADPLVRHRRHQLAVQLPPDPVCVIADHGRLTQVFVNLLNNAAKYTPEGGRIGVAVAAEGAEAVVRVSDNGAGISAEGLPLVFELFTQLDDRPGRPEGGLGIGLALVRQLVEMHGGSIAVASPGPGQGSEFTVRLPA